MNDEPVAATRTVTGVVHLRRVGFRRFPVNELTLGDEVVARLGHLGWLRLYMGRGVKVELADGTPWRLRSTVLGGMVSPVIANAERRKVALGTGGDGVYGVTGRDFGYSLNPGHRPRSRDAVWLLRHHEVDVAELRRRPNRFEAFEPVHVGAVLISLVLLQYGVPDDHRASMPRFHWS